MDRERFIKKIREMSSKPISAETGTRATALSIAGLNLFSAGISFVGGKNDALSIENIFVGALLAGAALSNKILPFKNH